MKNLIYTILATVLLLTSICSFAADTSDTDIVQSIKTQISADKTIPNVNVDVEATDGIVYLKGKINTDAEASRLVEIAESTPGVKNVDTADLKVKKSAHPLDDTYITAKVKGVFIREKLFGDRPVAAMSINVETKNGAVYLTGTADSQSQIDTAINLARSVEGVRDVQSKVVVK